MKNSMSAWVDETNKIISFHSVENSEVVTKEESVFWNWVVGLASSGYKLM